jgi:hypothetical protein
MVLANDRQFRVHVPSPLGFFAPPTLQTRGIHIPAQLICLSSRRGRQAAPRRGVPHPLCSASAVSHNCDGLLLLESCGLFQPLTPLGFALPALRSLSVPADPRAVQLERGGWVVVQRTPGSAPPTTRANGPSPRNHRSRRPKAMGPATVPRVRPWLSATRPLAWAIVLLHRPTGLPRSNRRDGKPPRPSLGPPSELLPLCAPTSDHVLP